MKPSDVRQQSRLYIREVLHSAGPVNRVWSGTSLSITKSTVQPTSTNTDRFWVDFDKTNRVQIQDGAAGPSIRQPEAATVLE